MKWTFLVIMMITLFQISAQDFYDIEQINEIELTFEQDNWDQILDQLYAVGEDRLLGTVVINGVQYDSVGVRYKGNSSYSPNREKNPFNIKLDYVIDDQLIDNYGTIKLANGFHDPSLVRETLAYEIARNYMPAGLANYANVYVNGELIGIYTSCQDVDKYFMSSHFNTSEKARFKGEVSDGPNSMFPIWGYEGADSTSYYDHYELESDTGWDELINFLNVFNNDTDYIEDVLNIDNHLWFLAFSNLLVHLDSPINFGHNYYLFQDASDHFNPILWDMNMAFGGFTRFLPYDEQSTTELQHLDPLHNINSSYYPIIGNVLSNNTYKRRYIAHMRTMIEEVFENGWYETRANELQDMIENDVQNDPNFFYSFANFQANVNSTVYSGGGGGGGAIVGIVQLMDVRVDYLLGSSAFQGTVPEIANVATDPASASPDEQITITVEVDDALNVSLGYRGNASDPFTEVAMYDDGAHDDGASGDGVYGTFLTAGYCDIDYYIYAENANQGAFFPARAQYEFETIDVEGETGDVVINEINYNSPDDHDTEDWIELYNPGSESVNLSGWVFKDEDDSHAFQIPDGTILDANAYLVLCESEELFMQYFPGVSNYVGDVGFGLSGGGELLRLYDTNENLIDSVEYDDESPWPTEPDGNGPTLELMDPESDNALAESWQASSMNYGTPGAANSNMSEDEEDIVPVSTEIMIYPNPFNPSTTVSFTIKQGNVKLAVYNIRGQRVVNLIDAVMPAGTHQVTWNGTNESGSAVSSGVYFFKLQTDESTKIRKALLMK